MCGLYASYRTGKLNLIVSTLINSPTIKDRKNSRKRKKATYIGSLLEFFDSVLCFFNNNLICFTCLLKPKTLSA